MKKLTVKEVEYISFRLAKELLSFKEPIPDFSSRFNNILESCLAIPFQTFTRKSPYRSLIDKASILFYLMIKNHPFQNGNKRIAMTTLFVFLYKNKKWLKVDTQELYNFTMWIAQSPSRFKSETLMAIKRFLDEHLETLKTIE
ncbi:MAG: type II toxin-antitoxin system death-on-curing family toxin [Candidatus Omnitrophica bacterium]|nr:type II toxin-antitoxin system death-on-curing family toxin [Candidatus Omnitrophota bacterium]MBU1905988.1 type II toxin-antitoxin system death-on-curing family toxin [Candidatus Omnitrophota bacterium]